MLTIETVTGMARAAADAGEDVSQVARLRELLEVNRLIAGTTDPEQVVPLVVEKTAALTGASECLLLLTDGGERAKVAAAIGLAAAHSAGFSTLLDENIDAALRQLLASRADDQMLAVPVVAGGVVDGVLAAHWRSPRRPRPDDEFLLSAMADQTAIALAHAVSYQRLYRSERDARQTAEHAVRTRDEFLAMVSHDLRNPLGTISMSSSMLSRQLSRQDLESAQRQAERIQRSVDQMLRLVDDLLDVAKMAAGTFSIERLPHDAVVLAREGLDPFVLAARERSLELRIDLPPQPVPVACDRQRVLQVLSNLLGNALKFTPASGTVGLRLERRSGEAVFSVTDTGPGIPEEELRHVFDRFWRANRRDQGGAGLGLFIARSLVEAHGGRIWAESVAGAGSVFCFALAVTDP